MMKLLMRLFCKDRVSQLRMIGHKGKSDMRIIASCFKVGDIIILLDENNICYRK